MDTALIWKTVLAELEVELGKGTVGLYFKNSQLYKLTGTEAIITFPNKTMLDSANTKFLDLIKAALVRQTKISEIVVKLEVGEKKKATETESLGPLFDTLPEEYKQPVRYEISDNYFKTKLSPRYALDTFVVGSTNNFAHAAALGIVKNPGKEYNPFFLFGGVGVGKTHLMQAVGNELYHKNPSLKILYVSAETFMNEYIESLGPKNTDLFRKKYRNLDLLMIDDIQSISGKEATQDEIFNTFNALHQAEKQIILTSDRRPEQIEKVQDRIISRFMGGLTVDIQLPDFETRIAIISEKLSARGEKWGREVVEFVAGRVESNIRELEGTLNRIITTAKISGRPVDLDLARDLLGQASVSSTSVKQAKVNPNLVITTIAKQFGIKSHDLLSDKRDTEFVRPRQMAMYILRVECKIKLEEVARLINRKDHTTVMHAVEKVKEMYKNDPSTKQLMTSIKRELWG